MHADGRDRRGAVVARTSNDGTLGMSMVTLVDFIYKEDRLFFFPVETNKVMLQGSGIFILVAANSEIHITRCNYLCGRIEISNIHKSRTPPATIASAHRERLTAAPRQ